MQEIPFNMPFLSGDEKTNISEALVQGMFSGDGKFTEKCSRWLEENTTTQRALLTQSCTAALEMAALLLEIKPGDEVIIPSYTFVSSANAFVLRGAVPVFADCRVDNANIDESKVEDLITPRTKAIVVVHYGGVSCDMKALLAVANKYGVALVEDAAQALGSTYEGRPLGSLGHMGTLSFHATKNVNSGEGGALLVNRKDLVGRAEIVREKGTDRSSFLRGEKDKYTWRDLGSSFLPSEITAAFLWGQLPHSEFVTNTRKAIWRQYYLELEPLQVAGHLLLPPFSSIEEGNGHIFFILVTSPNEKVPLIKHLAHKGIRATTHYEPLHASPAGQQFGRTPHDLNGTDYIFQRLVRLPIYPAMQNHVSNICDGVKSFYGSLGSKL